jgi:hypothetical protein
MENISRRRIGMEKKHIAKPKKKDDFLLTIKGNAPHGRIIIEFDFKNVGDLKQDDVDAYLQSTIIAIEDFRKEISHEPHEEWMKKNFPHYMKELERKKASSYVA